MTIEEWNDLAAALAESWKQNTANVPASAAAIVQDASHGTPEDSATAVAASRQQSTEPRISGGSVETIVRQVAETVTQTQAREAENQRPSSNTSQTASGRSSASDSGGSDVLKTIGMATGIGPVATALIKLFGGGSDDKAALPEPVKYALPPALQVNAGLTASRSLSQISYAQNDRVRAEEPVTDTRDSAPATAAPSQSIQINVNAMDSQSFMDHSDEIAQAVRAAMLRSHALNDVVSEI